MSFHSKKSKTYKELLKLDLFLKKHKHPNSIQTYSELLGYFASIACSPDSIEPQNWFFLIWNYVDEDIELGESYQEVLVFEKSCNFFLDDCSSKLYDRTYHEYFQDDYKIDISEWCKGFLRGRLFWQPYFGPIFKDISINNTSDSQKKGNSIEAFFTNPTIKKNEVASQKVDFTESSPEHDDDPDKIIHKDALFHKTKKEDELEDSIRIDALTFIGLVSTIGAPMGKQKDFGVYIAIDEKYQERIPHLIYRFEEYILSIFSECIPALDRDSALADAIMENSLSEYNEDEMSYFYSNLDSNGRPTANINPILEINRNDPCPCGSGKKYKKCCANKNY